MIVTQKLRLLKSVKTVFEHYFPYSGEMREIWSVKGGAKSWMVQCYEEDLGRCVRFTDS